MAIVCTLALIGCDTKPSDKDLVIVTAAEGQRLTAGERNLLGKTKTATWLDARTKADFDAGHIPGAMSLPFERVSLDYYQVKDISVLIVYGADFNDVRAKGMSKRLQELLPGHDIRLLNGGIREWTAAGNPLDPPAPPAATAPATP